MDESLIFDITVRRRTERCGLLKKLNVTSDLIEQTKFNTRSEFP